MDDIQRQAYARIQAKLKEIDNLINECVKIADDNAVEFHLRNPRSGADYIPESLKKEDPWNESDTISGWMSSSDYC